MTREDVLVGARYRHYKGNEYEVRAIGRHTETGEEMVVYRACYGDRATWIRPMSMFTDRVDHGGWVMPRFVLVALPGGTWQRYGPVVHYSCRILRLENCNEDQGP